MVSTAWKRSPESRHETSAMGDTGNGGAAKVQCCADAEHCEEGVGDAGLWSA